MNYLFTSKPEFPYVQECADCYHIGWFVKDGREAGIRYKLAVCDICEGRGYIIPPEWTSSEQE